MSRKIICPCCGERIEIVVDLSEPMQSYVEDCSVCCRPMVLTVEVDVAGNLWVGADCEGGDV